MLLASRDQSQGFFSIQVLCQEGLHCSGHHPCLLLPKFISYCLHLLPYQRGSTFVSLYVPLMCHISFYHSAFALSMQSVCHSAQKVPNPHIFKISNYVSFFNYHLKKNFLRKVCPESLKNITPPFHTISHHHVYFFQSTNKALTVDTVLSFGLFF